ncbi:hypothetical protein ScPMuIL_016097 [Solemya velum]
MFLPPNRESATNTVSSVGIYYKLPNLTLPSFSGDFLDWQTFWDSYQSSIHNNIGLTDVQKFSYLMTQLQGEASQCIAGLPLTSANYQQAIDLLTERFGQHHKIITAYMQSLIDLPSPKNSNGLKYFYDRMETYIRNLQSLGQCQDSYGTLLIPIIIRKLPADVRRNITRDNGSDKWELNSLRERIRKEICIQEAGDFESSEKNIIPKASFITKTSQSSVYETGPERMKYTDKVIRGDGPTAVLSKLGYLLSGPIHSGGSGPNTESLMMNTLADHKLEECDFERFWNIESLGIENQNRFENYTDIAKEYADTSIEFFHGKYTAKLPWKAEVPELQSNFGIVKRRTENVIRRLSRDPDLLRMYSKVLSEQEEKGFIERVDIASDCTNRIHYIPHHPVLKESATTPLRVYAVTTDIEKAFLQIGLHQEDRDITRFLWLSDSDDISSPLITYRFKSILFGATSSPFILKATLLKHRSDTAQVLERDLYVDNVLSSFDEKQHVIGFYHESRELLAKGGFNLRSWNSNCENLRTVASKEGVLDTENVVKILGMVWNVMTDMLLFSQTKVDISGEGNTTKRDILKQSSRIFDPLGILSPITVKAKILMQTLWKQNFDRISPASSTGELVAFCKSKGIHFQAYSSLGSSSENNQILVDPVLQNIAKQCVRHPAQVALRWAVQQGIGVIPKSSNPKHIAENFDIFSFELSDKQMDEINSLDKGTHYCWDPSAVK